MAYISIEQQFSKATINKLLIFGFDDIFRPLSRV